MSIAAVSSSFVAATRNLSPATPVAAVKAVPAMGAERGEGRRHALVDSMHRALDLGEPQTPAEAQATFRFAHALMNDLRALEAAGDSRVAGPGLACGQREWSELPQRIGALASAASAPAPATAQAAASATQAAVDELPPQPNPLTATSAAVHLMQVPSSRLLEAYTALHQALGAQADAGAEEATTRSGLASFLRRLSNQLDAGAPAELPGSVLHLTA